MLIRVNRHVDAAGLAARGALSCSSLPRFAVGALREMADCDH